MDLQMIRMSMLAAIILALSPLHSNARNYPARPIRAIVPVAPGGGVDLATRLVGQKLTERWGQQIIVENRAGANGNIGFAAVAKSAPDGYTLMFTSGTFVTNAALDDKLPFDPVKDFTGVVMVASTHFLLVAHPSVPANSIQDLLQLSKDERVKLTAAASGTGSTSYLAGEMLKLMAGAKFVSVPYKGTGPALAGVLAGETSFMFCDMIAAIPHVNSKRLRPLGIASAKRVKNLPAIPTVAESGVPGFDAAGWTAILAPAGVPTSIASKINSEVRNIITLPDIQERLAGDGQEFGANTPEYVNAFIKSEFVKWSKVIKEAGIKLSD